MKNNHYHWAIKKNQTRMENSGWRMVQTAVPLAIFYLPSSILALAMPVLLAANASAQSNPGDAVYQDATNRVSLSLRFGLNINAKFKGIGGSLNPSMYNGFGRKTAEGDKYNYDNGYVLTDVSGNAGGQSWYWGYDNASQVNAGNNTVSFDHTTAVANGGASGSADNNAATPGFELAYDRQLGVKENWHNMRYGVEAAFNYVPIAMNNNSTFGATASKQTDVYGYTPGTTPPSNPYQGSYNGPGFVINVPPGSSTTTIPNATVSTHDDFNANLWGFRLGPYLEFPFGKQEQFTLSLSAGLAVGLLNANESWKQTIAIPGNASITTHGGGSDLNVLWGGYAALNANYRINEKWGVIGGVQFQDLGKYNHSFDGRKVSLDLSQSVFVLAGISYNF